VARVYDYFLGGSHNFAIDRDMAAQLLRLAPDAGEVMRANRAFLGRAVRFMVSAGVTQFLDIGSGIPTIGNVHEIAQKADPTTRVVYVDLTAPVGLLVVSVLHFIGSDDHPHRAAAHLRDALAPGNFCAISHAAHAARIESAQIEQVYQRSTHQVTPRTAAEIAGFFGDYQLVEPGLVFLPQWRPDAADDVDEHPERFVSLAGVGQKP
jgi:hypothetical protein